MKITFCDRNAGLISNLIRVSSVIKINDATLVYKVGDPFELNIIADAIVSPANSFGFMDGGFDFYITKRFGTLVQERLQEKIKTHNLAGELFIGDAIAIDTDDLRIGSVISAPTMRVPRRIVDHIDIYLATKAAVLLAVHEKFESMIIPGMGTGIGSVPYDIAAMLMMKGVRDGLNPLSFPRSIEDAIIEEIEIKEL